MRRRPPRSTRTHRPFPYTTLFRSQAQALACAHGEGLGQAAVDRDRIADAARHARVHHVAEIAADRGVRPPPPVIEDPGDVAVDRDRRSEEHTSELQYLMRISYAVFCVKKKKNNTAKWPETLT